MERWRHARRCAKEAQQYRWMAKLTTEVYSSWPAQKMVSLPGIWRFVMRLKSGTHPLTCRNPYQCEEHEGATSVLMPSSSRLPSCCYLCPQSCNDLGLILNARSEMKCMQDGTCATFLV